MAKETKNRIGKKAFQAFVTELTLQRFRAACALVGKDQSEVAESLLAKFADGAGIPVAATDPSEPEPAKSKPRHK